MFSFVFTIKIVTYYDINVNLNLWFIVPTIHNYADAELFAIQIWVYRGVVNAVHRDFVPCLCSAYCYVVGTPTYFSTYSSRKVSKRMPFKGKTF